MKPSDAIYGWHFLAANSGGLPVLRDGRPLVVGEWLRHEGRAVICQSGLHGSYRAIDALAYAPGPFCCLVQVDGVVTEHDDKFVAVARKPLWCIDATEVLRLFARLCALDVVDRWDVPDVVREWLETGREEIRSAAESAASPPASPPPGPPPVQRVDPVRVITAPSASESYFGVDRSVDTQRLSGNRKDCTGLPLTEALVSLQWHGRPRLKRWSAAESAAESAARSAQNDLLESLLLTAGGGL